MLRLLEEGGFEAKRRGNTLSFWKAGWKNTVRFRSLGQGYTEEELRAVISGEREHNPKNKSESAAKIKPVNLLVDIQEKLQEGKEAGYVRWAKVFNLKQMAKTLNYLTENNLLEYASLAEKKIGRAHV